MGRRMSPEREAEFAELERFLEHYATRVFGIDRARPEHPSNALAQIAAKVGRSKALVGLRQAIGDCVESAHENGPEWIRQFDAECAALGIVTLSQLSVRYRAKYKAILKRGRIRNETEYYLITGVASDLTVPIPDEERVELGRLLGDFEKRVSSKSKDEGSPRARRRRVDPAAD